MLSLSFCVVLLSIVRFSFSFFFFFFNDTATTEIYTLSLHDALPICIRQDVRVHLLRVLDLVAAAATAAVHRGGRSEEHTSELQSPCNLVCRLLLEKKKKKKLTTHMSNISLVAINRFSCTALP